MNLAPFSCCRLTQRIMRKHWCHTTFSSSLSTLFQTWPQEEVLRTALSAVCLSHMNNAAGDSLLRHVHNNTEISGVFRWQVLQQAEAGCNILILLQRSHHLITCVCPRHQKPSWRLCLLRVWEHFLHITQKHLLLMLVLIWQRAQHMAKRELIKCYTFGQCYTVWLKHTHTLN